jgi:hypothetical protein
MFLPTLKHNIKNTYFSKKFIVFFFIIKCIILEREYSYFVIQLTCIYKHETKYMEGVQKIITLKQ